MLLYLLYPIVRFALWVFFRRLELRGRDQVPRGRPLIFVANHPNVLLDVLLLAALVPGKFPRFLGKSTLFENAFYAFCLRRLGAIPVVRSQDAGSPLARNQDMLLAACQTLKEGRTLALFPEGLSRAGLQVRPFKPGAARIALRVEDEGQAGVCIVPVGLTYSDSGLFRSEVSIHFGAPLEVRPFLEAYRANHSAGAQELTAQCYQRLLALTFHLEDPDLEVAIRDLAAVYTESIARQFPDTAELSNRLRAGQELIRAVHHFARIDPGLVQTFADRLRRHLDQLQRLALEPGALAPGLSPPGRAHLVLTLLLSPLAVYGMLHNALPYLLPRLFVRPYRQEPEMVGTIKLAVGTVAFPLYYLVCVLLAHWLWGWASALFYGCTLPLSGLFVLFYQERFLEKWPLWKSLIAPRQRRHRYRQLAQERALLIRDLDQLKEQYLASAPVPQENDHETA